MKLPYHPFYCEENIWRLCNSPLVDTAQSWAVLISNSAKACPVRGSKSAANRDEPVFWDYHTVLLELTPSPRIWDPECREPSPIPALAYLAFSFPHPLPSPFRPMFRLIKANAYCLDFSSDRSHMRPGDGSWIADPPAWPPIFNGRSSTLLEWIDMSRISPGIIVDLNGFRSFIETGPVNAVE